MKKYFFDHKMKLLTAIVSAGVLLFSCKKDSDGSNFSKPGDPVFGKISVDSAAAGATISITGSGLGDMRSIVFTNQDVPATVTPTLNTASSIVFRVPDTANGGKQNIVLTNSEGKKLTVPFNVLAYAAVIEVSNYNFTTGSLITLKGNNLNDVTKVLIKGTTDQATIVSQTRKEMVISMPATAAARAPLLITNATGTITTTQEFVSLDNNFAVYTDSWGPGAYNSGVQNWSYGLDGLNEVTDVVRTGSKALKVEYNDGGLSMFLGCNWATPNLTFADYFPDRKFLTFWAKGVDAEVPIKIVPDNPWGGNEMWGAATATGNTKIKIPKDVWTYFKIPAGFITGTFSRMNFIIDGTTKKTIYLDDVMWIK